MAFFPFSFCFLFYYLYLNLKPMTLLTTFNPPLKLIFLNDGLRGHVLLLIDGNSRLVQQVFAIVYSKFVELSTESILKTGKLKTCEKHFSKAVVLRFLDQKITKVFTAHLTKVIRPQIPI